MWPMNFQMFKLDLEEVVEPEIKLPTSDELLKKQENSRKHLLLLYWLCQSLCVNHKMCRKFFKRCKYQTTWPASWNLYAGQEATFGTGHGKIDWFQIGQGVCQGCILSPCLFNFYAEYIMRNAGLDEAQAGIKIVRRNINNLRYADDTTLTAQTEELKTSWWQWNRKVKRNYI